MYYILLLPTCVPLILHSKYLNKFNWIFKFTIIYIYLFSDEYQKNIGKNIYLYIYIYIYINLWNSINLY